MTIQLDEYPCIGLINTKHILLLTFSQSASCIVRWMILTFLWMMTFINRNLYVPSCLYQMFDTSVEHHGDCWLKPSSSMNLLTAMWYARKSKRSRTAVSQQYSTNYASLLLLIRRAQLFIILGEHKVQKNCSIHFFSLFSVDISVGSILHILFLCGSTTLEIWLSMKLWTTTLVLTVPMTAFPFSCASS